MATLTSLLKELENKIEFKDSKNPQISQSDVAWHIAHSLKVLCNILKCLILKNIAGNLIALEVWFTS